MHLANDHIHKKHTHISMTSKDFREKSIKNIPLMLIDAILAFNFKLGTSKSKIPNLKN